MKRSERDGLSAAQDILTEAGWGCEVERGKKHLIVVAVAPDGGRFRVPVAGSPSHGPTGAANLVKWTLRKVMNRASA